MKWHPAWVMIATWLFAAGLFFALPFHIVGRNITFYGYAILILFIAAFCVGAFVRSPVIKQRHAAVVDMPDFSRIDPVLAVASVVAMIVLLVEWRSGSGGDLEAAWLIRNDRATLLLNGQASNSSIAFQIGYLLSPVGYAIIAKELIFYDRLRFGRLILLGFGPCILSALALGGRNPLLLAFAIAGWSFMTRRILFRAYWQDQAPKLNASTIMLLLVSVVGGFFALNYVIDVFFVRAGLGGAAGVLDAAADQWGVSFEGPAAEAMKATLGIGTTYIIFVFAFYFAQGLIMGNVIFTSYDAPPQYGLYGIEVLGSIARRLDGGLIARNNASLFDLNVFGFFPGAFGTLYVDYWFFGLAVVFLWGYLAALVYEKVRTVSDGRWWLIAPFIGMNILFSTINTPFGLTNGLLTYFWLMLVFLMAKPRKSAQRETSCVALSAA